MRRLIPWVAALALALPACQDNIDDTDISDNFASIVTFSPLVGESDVTDLITKDDPATPLNEFEAAVRADQVVVTVNGNQRNALTIGFANDVILTSYTVQSTALDGIADALVPPDWFATINQTIPAGSTVSFTIEIVRLSDKASGVLADLDCTFGIGASCGQVRRASVLVTFTGADISGHPVTTSGFLTIVFTDFGDGEGADQGLL